MWLRRLVLKELGDNALDTGSAIEARHIDADRNSFFSSSPTKGRASTARRRRSPSYTRFGGRCGRASLSACRSAGRWATACAWWPVRCWRRRAGSPSSPTTGVSSLHPQADGSTKVVKTTSVDHPVGTRIEIGFGAALPRDANPLGWLHQAVAADTGRRSYDGKSSPYWYDPVQFH